MNKHHSGFVVAIIASLTLVVLSTIVKPATLLAPDQAAQIVTVRNVTEKDGTVKGELVNNSRQIVRDIELQILYSWRWKDEFHPGTDDPGRAVYLIIKKEFPPGQSPLSTSRRQRFPAARMATSMSASRSSDFHRSMAT